MATSKSGSRAAAGTSTRTTPRAARTPATRTARAAKSVLADGVVIEGRVGARRTGAQAIAPDHSPRAAAVAGRVATAAPGVTPALQRTVEQFLYHQAELLDAKDWQGWMDLFADDGLYWMPCSADQTDWEGWPSIFIEDKLMMEVRMGRITHPNAWSQAPLWMTSHVVSHVVVEKAGARELVVRSRFHMMELRRDDIRHFGGSYRHVLARGRGGLRIRHQRVDLFNAQAPFDYVLQAWV